MVMVGACGSGGLEVIVAASALAIKQQLLIPPLAEAWCEATDIRIDKVTAKAMLRPLSWHLSEVRIIMIVYPRKYNHDRRIIAQRAHQVFCKSSGSLAMFAAMRRASSFVSNFAAALPSGSFE